METFEIKLHSCGCGYKTLDKSNANRHKKTSCGQQMTSQTEEFVFKNEYAEKFPDEDKNELERVNMKLRKEIKKLKLQLQFVDDDEDDITDDEDVYPGLVYYVVDRELPTRGKIGRTMDMNIKKLKTRYSTFGDPLIICFVSMDIKTDEKKLKDAMKAAGCMNTERGKESIHHSENAMFVFQRVALQNQ
ncbi:protein of unknown function (DUF1390) [Paramecium bursaria Chlorella virus AN69C]|uniref:Uncharacterized protein n=1 Tax=Paramecium bursaria Chlorella virus IL3A TaxID=46019 RepID=M1HU99_PBCVI|nr:protein of unknown function (DUF1390) [Paramecium bursaria Chlorella virus AN69C]AGE53759.1 protein of unknown function (DUF1390) [Paramecium bursaria Chlorella virus IL3A]